LQRDNARIGEYETKLHLLTSEIENLTLALQARQKEVEELRNRAARGDT
jgi:predicted  nucleic acid-binding Zn-ribbon protein